MKKICLISLIIVSLFASVCAFADNAGNPPDYYVESNGTITMRSEMGQLGDMGIMSDGDMRISPYGAITRGEMARIITQLDGYDKLEVFNMTGEKRSCDFIDVSSKNPYFSSINYVSGSGIMNGYGNSLFLPDKDITYNEAVKTIITVLGYEPKAIQKGGYPQGYLTVANELGLILYPYAQDHNINGQEMCDIIHKALDVPLMKQNGFGAVESYIIMDGKNGVELQTLRTIREAK
ncbi:MAG: S-layer homology domain-containing protein [Clostridia bacterium]|nr:S-layer homology domain-containing protein [Clostridia bacterium]MBO7289193.1 S-layer homology domain-containing protein [Clostridia bacterium]